MVKVSFFVVFVSFSVSVKFVFASFLIVEVNCITLFTVRADPNENPTREFLSEGILQVNQVKIELRQ